MFQRCRHQVAVGLLGACGVLFAPFGARAELAAPGPDTVHFEYQAHSGCPEREEFVKKVKDRISQVELTAAPANRTLRVEITESADGKSRGRLHFEEQSSDTTRHISGDSCEAVAAALVLTTVLTLYAEAPAPTEATAPDPKAPEGATPEIATDPGPQGPPSEAGSPGVSAADSRAPSRDVSEATRLESDRGPAWHLAAGGLVGNPLAPGLLWGPSLGIEAEWAGSGVVSVSTRLLAHYARGARSVDMGNTRFAWGVLGIEFCPLRFGSDDLSLRPCLAALGGFLEGEGEGFENARSKMRSWWSLAAALRARLGVSDDIGIELWAAAVAPLVQRTFVIEGPTEVVAESPSLCGLTGVSVVGTLL